MPKFHYTAKNSHNLTEEGKIRAASKEEAKTKLQAKGLTIMFISDAAQLKGSFLTRPHLSFEDKVMFTKHMSAMIQSGITITEALQIMRDQTKQKSVRTMYDNIIKMVNSGETLARSLAEYKYIFSDIFINMIGVGEESGTLEDSLKYLDIQLEKEYELRKKVMAAFIYPSVIVFITIVMSLGIVVFIMPKIIKIFESFNGVVLPLPTRILIGVSTFLTDTPFKALLCIGGGIGLLIFLFKTKYLKPIWHKIILYTPVFGKILIYVNLARFSRSLNSLLKAGVPINRALDITSKLQTDQFYAKMVREAREKVEKGSRLDEALSGNEKLFPPITTKMLHIGEKSGNLELATEHLAKLYEEYVDNITKNLSVLLEPVLLVLMGLLVGGVALSIILPIYQLPSLIQS